MSRINVLDKQTANAIKAGEVIERPVSVVKELVDNSIDAGATSIKVEFENGGISLIRVSDNGIGMDREDAQKCFLIHATSKITSIEDIYDLSTQGFRGEALASIAACADITLITKQADKDVGTKITYEDGDQVYVGDCAGDNGTVISVSRLFANIPARYKFLKKDSTEGMYICTLVEKLAIINPHIAFKLVKDGKVVLSTPGSGDMLDAIYSVYGKDIAKGLIKLDYEFEGLKLRGYTGTTDMVRGNRAMQYIYVNDRSIRNASISAAIDEAYRNSVMKGKFPICFLCIYVPAGGVDVNIHPQKAEVKFSNDSDVFRLVYHGIKNAVFTSAQAKSTFSGLTSEPESVPEAKKLQPHVQSTAGSGSQLAYDVSRLTTQDKHVSGTSSSAPSEPKMDENSGRAVNELLQILSEFKPDINVIKGEEEVVAEQPQQVKEVFIEEPEIVVPQIKDDIDEILHSTFVGFLFATYIIMQSDTNVFFIDQHAAHERVMYEKFMARREQIDSESAQTQALLVPQLVTLSSGDFSFVSDNLDKFRESGFDIELMGERQIAIRAIPVADTAAVRLKSMDKPDVIFMSILSDLKREVPAKNGVWYQLIQTTACKAAIKAHDVITREEALDLIKQLSVLNDPYHCAHGRPVFIKVSMTDFEKNFKRIV